MKYIFFLKFLLCFQVFANEPGVQVENPFYYVKENGKTKIVTDSYRDRRSKWGVRVELGSSLYSPVEETVERNGTSFYGSFGFNRNFKNFSIGPELGVLSTNLKTASNDDVGVLMVMLGGNLYLDGLFNAPYVVPFLGVGAAVLDIDDETVSDSDTQEDFSPYFKAGVLVQLNWLDKLTAAKGYYNYGLENTFVVMQVRNVSKTNTDTDSNFGSSMSFELGVQLEF